MIAAIIILQEGNVFSERQKINKLPSGGRPAVLLNYRDVTVLARNGDKVVRHSNQLLMTNTV